MELGLAAKNEWRCGWFIRHNTTLEQFLEVLEPLRGRRGRFHLVSTRVVQSVTENLKRGIVGEALG
jgi:hypothetical protein